MDSSLLNFSDEVLISEVLPRLPLETLGRLCSSDARISTLCQDESLWQVKTQQEFSQESRMKPDLIHWRDYYQVLKIGKKIPVYFNGDVVGIVPFHPNLYHVTVALIIPYIDQSEQDGHIELYVETNIVFINNRREPIVIIKYDGISKIPNVVVKSTDYDSIEKVLFFAGLTFDFEAPVKQTRGRKPRVKDQSEIDEDRRKDNLETIYNELTSPFGHPPIYGVSFEPTYSEVPRYNWRFEFSDINDESQAFYIYIIDPDQDRRTSSGLRKCENYRVDELLQMAEMLNIEGGGLPRDELCHAIREKLKEIGHII